MPSGKCYDATMTLWTDDDEAYVQAIRVADRIAFNAELEARRKQGTWVEARATLYAEEYS